MLIKLRGRLDTFRNHPKYSEITETLDKVKTCLGTEIQWASRQTSHNSPDYPLITHFNAWESLYDLQHPNTESGHLFGYLIHGIGEVNWNIGFNRLKSMIHSEIGE